MLQKLLFILAVIKMTNPENSQPDRQNKFFIFLKEENFTEEDGLCIMVECFFTFPQHVLKPIRKTWFKVDSKNTTAEVEFYNSNSRRIIDSEGCSFRIQPLVQGKSDGEYRLKLEWGQGNIHTFPQTVKITVKERTKKPTINVPPLTAGKKAEISCKFTIRCVIATVPRVVWTGIRANQIKPTSQGVPGMEEFSSVIMFYPKAKHHNVKLTCTVILQENIQTEAMVTLQVRYAPKILNSSRCLLCGDELTCMCVSRGVPLPLIYWPTLDGPTKYCSTSLGNNTITISNISISGIRNINSTIECVSKNQIGTKRMEIQVQNQTEATKAASWTLPTPWIFFTLSAVINIILGLCCTTVLWRRKTQEKPKDGDHVYMTSLKREESFYETVQI